MSELESISTGFTELVATRKFELVSKGISKTVVVEIGRPVNDVETIEGFDWRCPIRFLIEGKIINEYACGIDSFQALSLAGHSAVKTVVEKLARDTNSEIYLHGGKYVFPEYPISI